MGVERESEIVEGWVQDGRGGEEEEKEKEKEDHKQRQSNRRQA